MVIDVDNKVYARFYQSVNSCLDFVCEMEVKLKNVVSSLKGVVKSNDIGCEEFFDLELMFNNETMWRKLTEEVVDSFKSYSEKLSRQEKRVTRIKSNNYAWSEEEIVFLLKQYTDQQISIVEEIHGLIRTYGEYIMTLEKEHKNNLDEEWLTKVKKALQESILKINEFYNNEYVENIKSVNEEIGALLKPNKR